MTIVLICLCTVLFGVLIACGHALLELEDKAHNLSQELAMACEARDCINRRYIDQANQLEATLDDSDTHLNTIIGLQLENAELQNDVHTMDDARIALFLESERYHKRMMELGREVADLKDANATFVAALKPRKKAAK